MLVLYIGKFIIKKIQSFCIYWKKNFNLKKILLFFSVTRHDILEVNNNTSITVSESYANIIMNILNNEDSDIMKVIQN